MTFPSIATEGYWNRENVWIVMIQDRNGAHWDSMHNTKAEAIEALRNRVEDTHPDAAWVVKSPYFVSEE